MFTMLTDWLQRRTALSGYYFPLRLGQAQSAAEAPQSECSIDFGSLSGILLYSL